MRAIVLASFVIAGMAIGQLLFKAASGSGSLLQIVASPIFWVAAVLYGAVTIAWVLLLTEMDLARAYPLMAATYVLVPIASALVFNESFGLLYGFGVILIAAGIVLTRFG